MKASGDSSRAAFRQTVTAVRARLLEALTQRDEEAAKAPAPKTEKEAANSAAAE